MSKIQMLHEEDPREVITKLLGDISRFEIGPRQIIAAIYLRPQKTKGGIELPRSNLEEDFYQSKACLVAKVGADATFCGTPVEVGEWIVVRPSDCWPIQVNGVRCRHMFDDNIRARIPEPDFVW